jgi:hypothetical protein
MIITAFKTNAYCINMRFAVLTGSSPSSSECWGDHGHVLQGQ